MLVLYDKFQWNDFELQWDSIILLYNKNMKSMTV